MRKSFSIFFVILAMSLQSCSGTSMCDCVKLSDKMMKEMSEAGNDANAETLSAIEKKYKSELDACKKIGEGKSEEEQAKMMEEMMKCN